MRFKTITSPHSKAGIAIDWVMLQVMLGLLPGTFAMIWFFGWGVLINLIFAISVALTSEAIMLFLRRKAIIPVLLDGSAIVTAWLLALALPPLAPWWIAVVGVGFAIVFGKQLYGGIGYNPFNPAMVGYVVLLISFPLEMTQWLTPKPLATQMLTFTECWQAIWQGLAPADGISGATPLDYMKIELALGKDLTTILTDPLFSLFNGMVAQGWFWVNAAYLLGGIYLLWRKVITWHTPVAMLTALALLAGIFMLIAPERYPNVLFHLFSGAAMLGAFFIATDPVSSATSNRGKLVYGAGIGILVYVIRTWGGYPDAVAFSVLLMNLAAPFIDYYTRPRVFGAK